MRLVAAGTGLVAFGVAWAGCGHLGFESHAPDGGAGPDGGTDSGVDGGTGRDSGVDGGVDGGTGRDSGVDGGTGPDGGTDSGVGPDAGPDAGLPDDWPPELAGWSYRKRLVAPSRQPQTVLVDFPALVSRVDADLREHALPSGHDLRFTTEAGGALEHQVERFDGADGALVAWVKLPTLDTSADTVVWLYYGEPGAVADPGVPTVWSNGFQAVYHLDETGAGAAGEFADATGAGNDGTGGDGAAGETPSRVAAQIGGGQDFDGVDDFIQGVPGLLENLTTLSLSVWANVRTTDNVTRPGLVGQNDALEMGFFWDDRINLWTAAISTRCPGKQLDSLCTPDFEVNRWMHLGVSWDGAEIVLYVDGVERHRVPMDTLTSSAFSFNIGGGGIFDESGNSLDGMLDEVRLSSTDRPAEWFVVEHANQSAPGAFWIVGPEERNPL